ncbi:uncharacterized protein KY384_000367 [Bacidia gigantensis]|uniref:uncharacterized protein n=1 Tax=Bacidia gigantensis TaxID=2732470 RepID=UPI001D0545A4|nr:uncharacterized protein KY384_000367 [Bacidia gigantensis]KAG8526374.1 hypothetical protein KY384_000367 [Bacidia gigantensis]
MPSPASSRTVYFGYGSNLWRDQMRKRCPESTYVGVGRLDKYRWIISERGYANVVPSSPSSNDYVYGLIYTLSSSDERRLDVNEGVPETYAKEMIDVRTWSEAQLKKVGSLKQEDSKPEKMLVYVDHKRLEEAKPKKEYIYRMNMGIHDAIAAGVPRSYVDEVMRRFIPPQEDEDGGARQLAEKQAENFEEE